MRVTNFGEQKNDYFTNNRNQMISFYRKINTEKPSLTHLYTKPNIKQVQNLEKLLKPKLKIVSILIKFSPQLPNKMYLSTSLQKSRVEV